MYNRNLLHALHLSDIIKYPVSRSTQNVHFVCTKMCGGSGPSFADTKGFEYNV